MPTLFEIGLREESRMRDDHYRAMSSSNARDRAAAARKAGLSVDDYMVRKHQARANEAASFRAGSQPGSSAAKPSRKAAVPGANAAAAPRRSPPIVDRAVEQARDAQEARAAAERHAKAKRERSAARWAKARAAVEAHDPRRRYAAAAEPVQPKPAAAPATASQARWDKANAKIDAQRIPANSDRSYVEFGPQA